MAVWKNDFRLGGSLDGEFAEVCGMEIKAPQKMYRQLIEYVEAFKKGYQEPPSGHIFISHYDQMIGNGVITNKQQMHYVVKSAEGDLYTEVFPVDYEYWNTDVYPRIVSFYETYVQPELFIRGITRIDPVMTAI